VDAYPAEDFSGTVAQVRLQPIIQQNVVTYATVIDVENPELKLKPGMTANVNIEIARRADVVRVPNAALRFRPTNEIFAALGQTPPGPAGLSAEGWGGEEGAGGPASGSATGDAGAGAPAGGGEALAGTNSGRGGRGGRALERLQSLPPEERQRVLERMRARGFDPTEASPRAGQRPADEPEAPAAAAPRDADARTFDALFGPLPAVESFGRVWAQTDDGQLRPVPVRLGISDGQATELLEGNVQPGMLLVTSVTTGAETRPAAAQGGIPPFMGPGNRIRGR
jgi:HlyD family secretion protein